MSFCTVDGKFYNAGDYDLDFCLQSTVKTLTYALARELTSKDYVHQHVGFEPSGVKFNAHVLNDHGLPHNPFINAGAIMVCSLIKPQEEMSVRYEAIKQFILRLSGKVAPIGFDNSVFLSEAHHADRNRSLAYFMRENKAFPENTHIEDTLSLYFQACSINASCRLLAAAAATLANQGVCPLSGEQVLSAGTARDTLSLMYMCGMYDWSGQFAFEIGLPAKSGVSGALMVSIPNVGGLCVWSPRLDVHGNSVRGVEYMQRFVKEVQCHIFHTVVTQKTKASDPVLALITATSKGDLEAVKKILKSGVDPNVHDYDKRAPMHLACAEGHLEVVKVLLAAKADPEFKDRWGNTAFSEATNAINNGLAGPELMDLLHAAAPHRRASEAAAVSASLPLKSPGAKKTAPVSFSAAAAPAAPAPVVTTKQA